MGSRFISLAIAAAIAAIAVPSAAVAAPPGPPPPPTAANGNPVKVVAHGVSVPTAFAFMGKTMFVAGGSEGAPTKGVTSGLFAVAPGSSVARQVPGSPSSVFGVAVRRGKLYVSAGRRMKVFSGWTGKRFKHSRTIFKGPKKFSGFGGIAFSPSGRLYAGIFLGPGGDHHATHGLYAQSVISMNRKGKKVKVIATGLRQPWQMTFVKGIRDPFVSDLAQDKPAGIVAPDFVIRARKGQDYGFPRCNWTSPRACRGYAKPLVKLPAHTSPMGIGAIGKTLYVAGFGAAPPASPKVMTMNTRGRDVKTFVSGFVPILSVATRGHWVYFGDMTGTIYRVRA